MKKSKKECTKCKSARDFNIGFLTAFKLYEKSKKNKICWHDYEKRSYGDKNFDEVVITKRFYTKPDHFFQQLFLFILMVLFLALLIFEHFV